MTEVFVSERPYTLVYDGDCRFCVRSADLVATWDRGGTVEMVPFQRAVPQPGGTPTPEG
jgi:predicted DCC family thiol-disulfide oxidoreductase YuxK